MTNQGAQSNASGADGALWDALFVQIKLFRRLSLDVSQALDCNHGDAIRRDIEATIRRLWREDREVAPKA